MEDKFTRYTKLYILIFLMFLSIPVMIGLLVGVFYGFSKIISSAPADFIFEMMILSIPASVFSSAYIIFLKRTQKHPSSLIKVCSVILFITGLICCGLFLTMDYISFFKQHSTDIVSYYCFSIPFMAGNTGGLFLIAIIQAFTTKKESDWLDRAGDGV